MSFDDSVVDEDAYYRRHLGASFEELQELHWDSAAAAIADARRLQDMRCDWAQRLEIMRLNVGRQERAYETRRLAAVQAWSQGLPAIWTHAGLMDRAHNELDDERERYSRIFAAATISVRSHRTRAEIALRIIRERHPDRRVGSNPYIGRLSRF